MITVGHGWWLSRPQDVHPSRVLSRLATNVPPHAMGGHTVAARLQVPTAASDFLMLRALRKTNGTAVAGSDAELVTAQMRMSSFDGIFACPEGGATLAALEELLAEGWASLNERIVLFNTATGLKCPDVYQLEKAR